MRQLMRIGVPTVIAAITLAACATSAGSGASIAPAASAGGSAATVTIKGFAFSPATVTIAKGKTVTFVNNDSTAHTISSGASRAKDGKFDTELSGGTETTITFDTPGTYDYFCNFHASMVAKVVVQ